MTSEVLSVSYAKDIPGLQMCRTSDIDSLLDMDRNPINAKVRVCP